MICGISYVSIEVKPKTSARSHHEILFRPGQLNGRATQASEYTPLRKVLTPEQPKFNVMDAPLL